MRRSITSNSDQTSAVVTFAEAAKATTTAWRRRHGATPCPPLSHALSVFENNAWTVRDSELGEIVAIVHEGMAVLIEDMPEGFNEEVA